MSWIIYKHTNKINGKVYIGQTNRDVNKRWGNNGKNYSVCYPFGKAIKKYGWNNFSHETIEKNIPNIDKANEREIYWIKKYQSYIGFKNSNGYNATLGGDNREDLGVPVLQINKKFKIVKEYKTITDAVNETGIITINGCIYNNQITAGGFYWIKKDDYNEMWKPRKKLTGPRSVVRLNRKTLEIIKIYKTIKEASIDSKINMSQIVSYCTGKTVSTKDFWCYEENYSSFKSPINDDKHVLQISMITLKVIKEYENVAKAVEATKGCFTFIDNVCLRKKRCAYGYFWCFKKDYSKDWKPIDLAKDFRGKSQRKKVMRMSDKKIYDSISSAGKLNNIDPSAIVRALKKHSKCNGSYWEYID